MKTYAGWELQFRQAWPFRNCNSKAREYCYFCIAKMRKMRALSRRKHEVV